MPDEEWINAQGNRTVSERALEDLERRIAVLTAQNEALNDVVYGVSHDLREPTRNVNTAVGMLARRLSGKLDAQDYSILSTAMESAARLIRMLDDMLAYCRTDRVKVPEEFPIREVVTVACENLAFQIEESNAQVEFGSLPVILCYRVLMVQLFQNLISNAIKYRSATRLNIAITAERKGEDWLFAVRDNGKGFDQVSSEKIFRLFFQLDRTAGDSSGIGLALCKKIVQIHNGRIWVESEIGQGATFFFTISRNGPVLDSDLELKRR